MNTNLLKTSICGWKMLFFLLILCLPSQTQAISVSREEALGRESLRLAEKQYQFVQDLCIVSYVNRVGHNLVSKLGPQPFAYRFYVIQKDEYNAFAAPGGHIFIHSGLLAAMESEEELAGILSHEIAHVVCRHISGNIDRSKKIQMASLAGIAAGILLGLGGAGTAAQAVTVGTVAGSQSVQLAYSREDEKQADQLGLTILAKSGYGASGLLTILKKIRAKDWLGSDIPTYLKTHPATEERMAYISSWIEDHQTKPAQMNPANNYRFQRMRTKLIALYDNPEVASRKFKQILAHDPDNLIANYGYALVLERSMNLDAAMEHLKIAVKKNPFDPFILSDLGKMYYRNGNYPESVKILDHYIERYPKDQEIRFYLASAQMKAGRLNEAAANFKKLVQIQRPQTSDPGKKDSGEAPQKPPRANEIHRPNSISTKALYSLAQIFHQQGLEVDSHFYLGRYYREAGNLAAAKFHLEKALGLAGEPKKKEKIKTYLANLNKKGPPQAAKAPR